MDGRELPLHGGLKEEINETKDPRIQWAPNGVDGVRPIGAEVRVADIEVGDAVGVHRLALDGGVGMQRAERNGEGTAQVAYL